MLATISYSGTNATDLGYLLHKHPAKVQTFEMSVGHAHVFYPESTDEKCTVAVLLEVALEDSAEDPSAVPHALGIIARSQNMSELARRVGMSRDGLYKALSEEGNPTWSTILKVTNALGLRFELHTVA